jgi:glycerate 2-kinase
VRAGVDAVSARRVIARALADPQIADVLTTRPLHVVAAGKAAAAMAAAFSSVSHLSIRHAIAIGTHSHAELPGSVEWIEASHPYPDARSEAAGNRAIAIAQGVHSGEALVILLSGGASALMAAPIDGLSLADKIETTRVMMMAGAHIHALNTVRRHLSKVKGGRLAAACVGTTITLAISDVVGDDLHAIGSGPGVPDETTWADAAAALDRFGGDAHSERVRSIVRQGLDGKLADTPKPGHPALSRARARVIGSRVDAMEGARVAAVERGYHTIVLDEPITGEARDVAPQWLRRAQTSLASVPRPACVISSGETTVRVTGNGKGGRNLEFVLALAEPLRSTPGVAVASIGTDGIDGSSGVAGAIADSTTLVRAAAAGLAAPGNFFAVNDSFAFFAPLDDDVRLGRTDTNVGDIQVLLSD